LSVSFLFLWGCPQTKPAEEKPPTRREVVKTDSGPDRKAPDVAPDKTPEKVAEKVAEKTPEKVVDAGPDLGPTAVNGRLRFKGGERIANDLGQALVLKVTELCKELGKYDCIKDVHNITLRGVSPYKQAIYTPWKMPPVIAPISLDRVVIAACQNRVKKDFADPTKAVVFKAIADSKDPDSKALGSVVETLYKRLLLRKPTEKETKLLVDFMAKVKARSKQPAQDWATLTCFGVGTSLEFIFY
jgi:hypothetical protein